MAKITQELKEKGELPENAVVTLELRPKRRRRQADENRDQEVVVVINTPVDIVNPDALTNEQIIENEGNSIAGVFNGTVYNSEGELFPGTRQQPVDNQESTQESEASTTTSTTTAKSEEPVTEATQAPVSSTQATDGSDGSSAVVTLMSLYFTGFLLC